MLQLEEKRIEVGVSVISVKGNSVHQGIERDTQRGAHVIQVVVLGQMAGGAALIADGSNPAMSQLILATESVVITIGRGFIRRKSRQRDGRAAGNGQIVAAKGHDGIWIRGISIRIVYVRGKRATAVQK